MLTVNRHSSKGLVLLSSCIHIGHWKIAMVAGYGRGPRNVGKYRWDF